jgi:hypothetical protein
MMGSVCSGSLPLRRHSVAPPSEPSWKETLPAYFEPDRMRDPRKAERHGASAGFAPGSPRRGQHPALFRVGELLPLHLGGIHEHSFNRPVF